jgi:L,D-transpeptidase catalytic domain
MRRILAATVLVVLVALVAVGGAGNVYAYEQRTRTLQQQWNDAEAAGVPRARIEPLREQLRSTESQRGGAVVYAATSMTLVRNPLQGLQHQTQRIYDQATSESRSQAETALAKLKQEYGPTPFDQARYDQQLHAASKPLDFQKLARAWTGEQQQLVDTKGQLGAVAGGFNNGLPVDVLGGRDQLRQTTDQLRQVELWTDPADQTLSLAQQYLGGSYQRMLAQHDDVKKQLDAGNATLGRRLDLRKKGNDLVRSVPALVQYGQGGDYSNRAEQAKQALLAARDDDQLGAAVNTLQGIVVELGQKKLESLQRLAAGTSGCESNAAGKLILVSLSQQRLVACDGTTTAYSAPVTSGRPGMETPTGTTTISFKQSPWLMKPEASCKQGDPCWYKATQVNYVMLFRSGGYYLHDWPPQESSAFGRGTQAGRFGSHGCVHVPVGVLTQLYDWAPIGTTVIVTA